MNFKNVLKFLLFAGLGAGLIYLIVHKITPEEWKNIKIAAANANYFWVIISLSLGILSHFLRALRWRMMIEPIPNTDNPGGKGINPGILNTFCAVMIGYMANYALPRLGEVSKCAIISKYEKVTFAGLIGTVIVERIIDLIMLFVFFLIMLLFNFSKVYSVIRDKAAIFIGGKWDSVKHINPLIIIAIAVVLIAGIWFLYKKWNNLFGFAKKFITNFLDGIKSIGNLKKPLLFWVYSFAIWTLYLLMLYVCFFCFTNSDLNNDTSHLNLSDALVVFIFGTVGVVIPTPGGVGAYQWLVIKALTGIFFVSYSTAFDLAWIVWGSQLVLIVFLGLISLLLLPIINKNDQTGVLKVENI